MSDSSQGIDACPLVLDNPGAAPRDGAQTANWAAVLSLSLGVFGLVTCEFLPSSILTPIAADLGVSIGAAGQAVTATAVVGIASGLFTGILTRGIDRRYVMMALTAMLIVSSLIAAVAESFATLMIGRLLLGIGLGGFWSLVGSLALRLVPTESVARAMSIVFAGVSAATVFAAPIGVYIEDVWGWRMAFYGTAVLGVIALLMQAIALPSLPPLSAPSLKSIGRLLLWPRFAIGLGILLLVFSASLGGTTYIRPYLEQVQGFSVNAMSLTLLAFGVAGFFGTLLAGFILSRSIRLDLAIGALAISATTGLLLMLGQAPLAAAIVVALWGLAFGLIPVGFQTWGVTVAPDQPEAVGALLVVGVNLAITIGAALGGVIVDMAGPLGVIVYTSLASLAGGVLMLSQRRLAEPA